MPVSKLSLIKDCLGNYVALKKLSPNAKQAQTTHAQSGAPHLSTWRYVGTSIDFFVFWKNGFRQKSLKSRVLTKIIVFSKQV